MKLAFPFARFSLPVVPVAAILMTLGIGCASSPAPSPAAEPDALDVSAPSKSAEPAITRTPPVYTPPPAPVFAPTPPAAEAEATPAKATPLTPAAPSKSDSTYTVQKGDTLFRIAKDRYGDGTMWQKIVSANPGVSASHLKVGQKLKMP